MSKTSGFALFILGAAVGSLATWQYVKQKYEQMYQAEIDSDNEAALSAINPDPSEDDRAKAELAKEKPDLSGYAERLKNHGYVNYSNTASGADEKPASDELMVSYKPYVIAPESFGEFGDDYEQISLTYYADQVLTDESDRPVEDIDNSVGMESLSTFGQYEDDSVFVRNDRLKVDYEILLDQRNYSDVVKNRPREVN